MQTNTDQKNLRVWTLFTQSLWRKYSFADILWNPIMEEDHAWTKIKWIHNFCKINYENVINHCPKHVQIRSFFWSVFSRFWTEYRYLLCKSLYSVQKWENTDQKKLRIWTLFMQWMSLFSGPIKRMAGSTTFSQKSENICRENTWICSRAIKKTSCYCLRHFKVVWKILY